jgi:large subunit ribosomal protein L21
MYAVFETGGKQYKAQKGDIVFVERLGLEPGKTVSFDALMISDGDDVLIGTPIVKGAKVRAKVVEHGKERKIVVFKYKPKIHERIKQGHRQPFTKIEITGITKSGKASEDAAVEAAVEVTPEVKPVEKKPAVKTTAAKTADKPAAAKTAAVKPAAKAEAKPAAKAATAKKADAGAAAEKKPAAKKPAAKAADTKKETK